MVAEMDDAVKTGFLKYSRVVGKETYKAVIAANGRRPLDTAGTDGASCRAEPVAGDDNLVLLSIEAAQNAKVSWKVAFAKK